jgi:protein-tyrosine phosphatase
MAKLAKGLRGSASSALAAALLAFTAHGGRALAATSAVASAVRERAIPFLHADVASADGSKFLISWSAAPSAGAVDVIARRTARATATKSGSMIVGRGGARGQISVAALPSAPRWYFELRPRHGEPLVIADRSLHLATAPNFRDIGGYRTTDGRWVKMGLVYRSDQLDRLDDSDLATIAKLAPSLVVDLRTEKERRNGPDRLPQGAEGLVADVLATSPPDVNAVLKGPSPETGVNFLVAANRQFVSMPSARAAYASLVSRVPTEKGAVVYHCSAGKDRTGWGTAVLLTAVGVPRQTVMADYLASNANLTDKNRALFATMQPAMAARMEPVMTVRGAYLDAAFDEVDRRYGSFDNYLRLGLGIDAPTLAKLRARLLSGAPTH